LSGLSKKNIETSLKFVYSDNNSLSVIFHDNDLLMGVVGEFNKNLKELVKFNFSSFNLSKILFSAKLICGDNFSYNVLYKLKIGNKVVKNINEKKRKIHKNL